MMNDLDALIAGGEALERCTRDKLLADGEDEGRLTELAAEVVDVQEPTGDERLAFGLVYRVVTSSPSVALADPARSSCFYGMKLRQEAAPLFDPGYFLTHAEDQGWLYDDRAGAVLFVHEPAHGWQEPRRFTPIATRGEDLLPHLDHELRRAAAEIVEQAYQAGPIFSSRCARSRMAAYLDPEAHIEPVRLLQVVHDAARGALRVRASSTGRWEGLRSSVTEG
jgi:hypothetical protein